MLLPTYVEGSLAPEESGLLDRNDGQLQHHRHESVTAELLSNTTHNQLVEYRADKKGDKHSNRLREVGAGGEVDVAE